MTVDSWKLFLYNDTINKLLTKTYHTIYYMYTMFSVVYKIMLKKQKNRRDLMAEEKIGHLIKLPLDAINEAVEAEPRVI